MFSRLLALVGATLFLASTAQAQFGNFRPKMPRECRPLIQNLKKFTWECAPPGNIPGPKSQHGIFSISISESKNLEEVRFNFTNKIFPNDKNGFELKCSVSNYDCIEFHMETNYGGYQKAIYINSDGVIYSALSTSDSKSTINRYSPFLIRNLKTVARQSLSSHP